MAASFIPAALAATATPWPWDSGQLVAFTGGDAFLNTGPQGPTTTTTDATATTDRLTDALPIPAAAVTPETGGFAPVQILSAVDSLVRSAIDAADRVGDLLGQIWGALNGRATIPGTPAQYERGAPQGNWNPTGSNRFRVQLFGRRYAGSPLDCPGGINEGTPVSEAATGWVTIPDGGLLTVGYWPDTFTAPFTSVEIYAGDAFLYVPGAHGGQELWGFARLGGLAVSSAVQVQVEPIEGPGVPYPATVPAIPPAADPLALIPQAPAPEPLPAVNPADPSPVRPKVLPPVPAVPEPVAPDAVPDAEPITQPSPDVPGISRQVTTITGALTGILRASRPRIAPMPAGPIPGLEPYLDPSGQPKAKPAPAPITTPQDARQYGTQTITSGAPSTSPQAIANEIGRIEQKLALLLPMASPSSSWLDKLGDTLQDYIIRRILNELLGDQNPDTGGNLPETVYTFTPPYDTPGMGLAEEAEYQIPADKLGPAIVSRLDAIADALQVIAPWRVKLSKGDALKANVTLTAHGTPDP